MDEKIKQLLDWCVTDYQPAFYDCESATAIEQTGILHEKIKELISEYHEFLFKSDEFKNCLTKIIHNYIHMIDDKIKMQDLVIDKADKYMKENIVETSRNVITQAIQDGDLSIVSNYENETIYLTITDNGGGE